MKPDNFLAHIHDENYAERFEASAVGAESLIHEAFRERESLDGEWRFNVDIYDTARRHRWYEGRKFDDAGRSYPWDHDFDEWESIQVPSVWNTADRAYLYYEGTALYTRKFNFEPVEGERVFLRFGAVYHESTIFLNGSLAGFHRGGDTPFFLEVTHLIAEENRLLVSVDNKRAFDRIPAYCTDWYNYGGIHRSVDLLRLPASFIRNLFIHLEPNSGFGKIRAAVELSDSSGGGEVRLGIPEAGIEQTIPCRNGAGEIVFEWSPELWSPGNPKLYDIHARWNHDMIRDRVGFREVRTRGRKILLNGEPIKLKGISCHEDSVENGRSLTEAEVRENFALIKELGGNFMRLAHYPHHERSARIADEAGILLWEEIPVYWHIQFGNPEVLADARQQLTELVRRDRNRASVIIWSVGNENPDTNDRLAFMGNLADLAGKEDPARLVGAACLEKNHRIDDRLSEKLDVIGINEYYGWYNPDFTRLESFFSRSNPDKPVIVTETGAGALAGCHGTSEEMFTEEYQERVYREQVRCIGAADYIAGLSPWILYDFRTPVRLNRYQRGYNLKGLLSADKTTKKKAFRVLREFYAEWSE